MKVRFLSSIVEGVAPDFSLLLGVQPAIIIINDLTFKAKCLNLSKNECTVKIILQTPNTFINFL